jgi:hypothetical protein
VYHFHPLYWQARRRAPANRRCTLSAVVLAALCSALGASAAAEELFRCGSWVVSVDMSVAELKQKCGEPTRRTVETQDVYAHAAGGGTIKTGTTTVEHWVYERSRASSMVVTITDGVITAMESRQ